MRSFKILAVAILTLSMTSCTECESAFSVRGNGNVVKKEREAGVFTGIKVSTGIDVYIKQSDEISLTVEVDENLHEYLMTENRDGVLHIWFKVNVRSAESKKVYVSMKDIDYLSTSSAGDIIGETAIRTDNLKVNASSAGDIKLEVYAKEVEANISSSGNITLTGEADELDADLSSAGDLKAYEFRVKEADVRASSAGSADIWVTERLIGRASSAGDINYKGNPPYVDANSSSAGGIHKR